jgi:L-ascorbate metabolism protein UlaG (beta-lactamase superfamily)
MKILLVILIILIAIILGFIFLGWIFSAPAYHGPISDHFDGKRFFNPGGIAPKGFKDMMKWMRTRQKGEWKESEAADYGPPPVERVEGDSIVVTFINHSTFLIQTQGKNILTDPLWSERASPLAFIGPKRKRPPGIRFGDLPKIDIILISHNHYDHLDVRTLKKLSEKFVPEIFCPLGTGIYLERKGIGNVREMDWWDEIKIDSALSILCTPAQHFSGRGMFDRDRTLWAGFALRTVKGSIYFSGDTGFGEFFKEIARRISPVRLAFLPIGAYKPEWFMAPIHTSPEDAVKIHQIINSSETVSMHFGTFSMADDGMEEPVEELKKVLESQGIQADQIHVVKEGTVIKR